jgi:hypothetical protein
MKKSLVGAIFLGMLLLPLMAHAASFEVFGGYQYLRTGDIQSESGSNQDWNGWNAAGTFNFGHHFGVTGDFSGTYATIDGISSHIYTYSGGPVVFTHIGPIKPFAHALFGGINRGASNEGVSFSQTGFTTMVGGGLDFKVNRFFAFRIPQVDWLYYHYGSSVIAGVGIPSFSQSNNVRLSSGIVIKF